MVARPGAALRSLGRRSLRRINNEASVSSLFD
jgi:hypothetical protein